MYVCVRVYMYIYIYIFIFNMNNTIAFSLRGLLFCRVGDGGRV